MSETDFSAEAEAKDDDSQVGADGARKSQAQIEGERSWRSLLALDSDLFQQKKVRLLTPEARVLIHLKLDGSMPVTEAMKLAGVSYRGFYAVLERLKQAGLVGQVKDKQDQRVRNLRLEPSMPIPPDHL